MTTTTTTATAGGFGVRVTWGRYVPVAPDATQTKAVITVPGLAPVTLLLTGGLSPELPWGQLTHQALRLADTGRALAADRRELAALRAWLTHPGHPAQFDRAWADWRDRQLTDQADALTRRLAAHRATWPHLEPTPDPGTGPGSGRPRFHISIRLVRVSTDRRKPPFTGT